MQQEKEQTVPVSWRIKASGIEWLREKGREQDRTVTWVINKLIEQAKRAEEGEPEKLSMSTLNSTSNQRSQESAV